MNKNIITVSIILTASIFSDNVVMPIFERYSDDYIVNIATKDSYISQISQTTLNGQKSYFDLPHINSAISSKDIILDNQRDEINILIDIMNRLSQSKPMPTEFSKIVDEDFWELVC